MKRVRSEGFRGCLSRTVCCFTKTMCWAELSERNFKGIAGKGEKQKKHQNIFVIVIQNHITFLKTWVLIRVPYSTKIRMYVNISLSSKYPTIISIPVSPKGQSDLTILLKFVSVYDAYDVNDACSLRTVTLTHNLTSLVVRSFGAVTEIQKN